jgi:hypothetical protein
MLILAHIGSCKKKATRRVALVVERARTSDARQSHVVQTLGLQGGHASARRDERRRATRFALLPVPSGKRLELRDAISATLKLTDQAARSID